MLRLLLAAAILSFATPTAAASINGWATIYDGDTIEVAGRKIRLVGIDAPELRQRCRDARGIERACGKEALRALLRMIAGTSVRCEAGTADRYGRLLAVCYAGSIDLNARMVATGHALAFVKYDARYLPLERQAASARLGLWAGKFDKPWDWRREQAARAEKTIDTEAAVRGCVIKGNISRSGERIYHLPGQIDYAKVRIDKRSGERIFCSEPEAIAAGWRRAVR